MSEGKLYASEATKVWDATSINSLKYHAISDGHPLCSAALTPLFADGPEATAEIVTCARCLRKMER